MCVYVYIYIYICIRTKPKNDTHIMYQGISSEEKHLIGILKQETHRKHPVLPKGNLSQRSWTYTNGLPYVPEPYAQDRKKKANGKPSCALDTSSRKVGILS